MLTQVRSGASTLVLGLMCAVAAGATETKLADVEVSTTALAVRPLEGFECVSVIVAGPHGVVAERVPARGEAVLVPLRGAEGQAPVDGQYVYELRFASRPGAPAAQAVQHGTFAIVDGVVYAGDAEQQSSPSATARSAGTGDPDKGGGPAPDDVVISDDLIVIGRACIGFECDDGESFGAETAKLKDKDTRLKFQDTSTDSGVPTTDWQLTANDTSSGGVSRFSLDDLDAGTTPVTVRGGAPTHSVYVAGNGDVGMGTATPLSTLHIAGSDGNTQMRVVESSGTAALRTMVAAVNYGASRITWANLQTGVTWGADSDANGDFAINEIVSAGTEFVLTSAGNLTIEGTLTQNSDRDTKDGIRGVDPQGVLAKLAALPISTWHSKGDAQGVRHMGPMAQDFAAAFGLGADERHLAPVDVGGVALAAIQALNATLTRKDAQLQALEQQNAELAARLAALERALAAK